MNKSELALLFIHYVYVVAECCLAAEALGGSCCVQSNKTELFCQLSHCVNEEKKSPLVSVGWQTSNTLHSLQRILKSE